MRYFVYFKFSWKARNSRWNIEIQLYIGFEPMIIVKSKWNLKGSKNIARLCCALCTAERTDQTEFLNLSRICIHKIKNKFAFKEFYTYFRSAKFSEIPTEMKSLNFALQNSKNKLNNWKVNASRKYAYAWLSNKRTEYLEVNEFTCTSKILFKENHSASLEKSIQNLESCFDCLAIQRGNNYFE